MKWFVVMVLMLHSIVAWTQPFEFNGFKLGMSKKELGGMSMAMRPWKSPSMMDTRKDEWELRPKSLQTLPPFPKTETHYSIKPVIVSMKLSFTNGVLCKISVEGGTTRSSATALTWANAASEIITSKIGKPAFECKELEDQSSDMLLESLRQKGRVFVFWPTASINIFRWADSISSRDLAGKIAMDFEVSSYQMFNIKKEDKD